LLCCECCCCECYWCHNCHLSKCCCDSPLNCCQDVDDENFNNSLLE
jgi:hypothetical protein